jgi:hypothetical protein
MNVKEILYSKVKAGLEGDDIILEIKILNTRIEDWNQFIQIVKGKYAIKCFGVKTIPKNGIIDESFFPQPPDYENNEFKIYFSAFRLLIIFYEVDTIEIFTDSVVRLSLEELSPLFEFIEYLGSNMKKDIPVYVESTTKPIFTFKSDHWE